jgi:hypothetical protein
VTTTDSHKVFFSRSSGDKYTIETTAATCSCSWNFRYKGSLSWTLLDEVVEHFSSIECQQPPGLVMHYPVSY